MKDPILPDNPSFFNETVKYEYLFRLNRAIDYIQKHYDQELSLTKLAAIACFSKYHFHRLFRALVGETLNDFVRRIRLEKAVHKLILEKHKSITDIALDCGFSSSQNFAKVFKSYFGVTATFLREKRGWKTIQGGSNNLITLRAPVIQNQWADLTNNFRSRSRLLIRYIMERRRAISVRILEIPSYRVAYIRRIGPYRPVKITTDFSRLLKWAAPRGLGDEKSILIGAVWNNPFVTPEERCICDACLTIPESLKTAEGINVQTLPGGKFAVYHRELGDDEFAEAWMRLIYDWLITSDYQPDDRPSYVVIYHDRGLPPGKPRMVDLCLPIKPLG